MHTTRLLLVDDHQLILDSLQTLFVSMPGIEVVGMSNDSRRVPEILIRTAVDVLLCDLHMPYLSGIDLTLLLRRTHPTVKVLLLTMAEHVYFCGASQRRIQASSQPELNFERGPY